MQINEFVKLGGDQLVPYYADILGAILPCISDKEEKIRVVSWFFSLLYLVWCAFLLFSLMLRSLFIDFIYFKKLSNKIYLFLKVARETNEELRAIKADPAEGFDVGSILCIARRSNFFNNLQNKHSEMLLESCTFMGIYCLCSIRSYANVN